MEFDVFQRHYHQGIKSAISLPAESWSRRSGWVGERVAPPDEYDPSVEVRSMAPNLMYDKAEGMLSICCYSSETPLVRGGRYVISPTDSDSCVLVQG